MSPDLDKTYKVEFQPQGKRTHVAKGISLLEAGRKCSIPIASDCGGQGRCGRCRVKVIEGEISLACRDEKEVLKNKQVNLQDRLACMAKLHGDARIFIPSTSLIEEQVLLLNGKYSPPEQAGKLSKDHLTVFSPDGIPHDVDISRTASIGIAFDIGTTSIAGRLMDLSSKTEICTAGSMNPQISLGEDVISRLNYALHTPNGDLELSDLVRKALNTLADKLCRQGKVSPSQVTDIIICANTAMSHLLLNLPVEQLAKAPYIAGVKNQLSFTAIDLNLSHIPHALVKIIPCIHGFVGGDHVAMILALGLDNVQNTVLGIDIGTNTEIVLAKPGVKTRLFVASCASGPALEGAHIRDGMRAGPGAIERVRISDQGPVVETVNNSTPVGLCGSGLVDAVSELLKTGILDSRGHLDRKNSKIISAKEGGAPSYLLVPAEKSSSDDNILITQSDISEIQLAKGAIHAGIQTILEQTQTPAGQIDCVYLAGAFGSYINIDSALAIGLFPHLPGARFVQVGNAALTGASLALISKKNCERAQAIALKANHVELAGNQGFTRKMVRAMRF